MARYFFNIHYGGARIDSVGEELPDDQTAWREATIISGELFRELDGKFQPGQQWRLEVLGETRELLYVIWLTGQQAK